MGRRCPFPLLSRKALVPLDTVLKESHLHSRYFPNHLKQQPECCRPVFDDWPIWVLLTPSTLLMGGRAMTKVRRGTPALSWECPLKGNTLDVSLASYSPQPPGKAQLENNDKAVIIYILYTVSILTAPPTSRLCLPSCFPAPPKHSNTENRLVSNTAMASECSSARESHTSRFKLKARKD